MSKSIWKGTLGFGMAVIPVRLNVILSNEGNGDSHKYRKSDGSRIELRRFAKADGLPVAWEELEDGTEMPDGTVVLVTREDRERALGERTRHIKVTSFTREPGVPRAAHDVTYVIEPLPGGEHAYELMAKAMERLGVTAVAKFALRDREANALVTSRDGYLYAERVTWAAKVLDPGFAAPATGITEAELGMAAQLVEALSGDFSWQAEQDTGAAALAAVIRAKAETGQVIAAAPQPETAVTPPGDLMAVLAASVAKAKADRVPAPRTRAPRAAAKKVRAA